MSRLLFTVKDAFEIRGRLVLAPGIQPQEYERFRIGDIVSLRRPDGIVANRQIDGFEFISPNPSKAVVICFHDLRKSDVPIGTEFWSTP